ncbi:MAG: signal peptidase II [Candidatus Krumholzibacteriia bacterium]
MIFYVIAAVTALLDQASKWIVVHHVEHGPVLGELVRLTLTYNSGAAFGMFSGARAPFIVISVVAAVGLIYAHHVLPAVDRTRRIPMALILGGNLGNLVDRLRVGRVTDFIDMGFGDARWPTYNIADIAVVLGAVALALTLIVEMLQEKRTTPREASETVAAGNSADAR